MVYVPLCSIFTMDAVEVTSKLVEDVRVLGKRLRRVKDEVESALRVKRVKGDVYERAAALEIQRVFRGWSLRRSIPSLPKNWAKMSDVRRRTYALKDRWTLLEWNLVKIKDIFRKCL